METEIKLTKRQQEIIDRLKSGDKIFYWAPHESHNSKWGACIETKTGNRENVKIFLLQKMWVKGLLNRTESMQYVLP